MPDILPIEVAALLLGIVSIGSADFLYHSGSIGHWLHSLWVSVSIAAICAPILIWTVDVFVGPGKTARAVAGLLAGAVFLWLYRNLRNLPAARKLGHGLPLPPPEQPPPSTLGG